jgi:hypothetical protein
MRAFSRSRFIRVGRDLWAIQTPQHILLYGSYSGLRLAACGKHTFTEQTLYSRKSVSCDSTVVP